MDIHNRRAIDNKQLNEAIEAGEIALNALNANPTHQSLEAANILRNHVERGIEIADKIGEGLKRRAEIKAANRVEGSARWVDKIKQEEKGDGHGI